MQHSRHQVLNTACPLAMCSSRSVAVGAVGATSFFHRPALLDIFRNCWNTAARASPFFHPDLWSIDITSRNSSPSLHGNSLWGLSFTLQYNAQRFFTSVMRVSEAFLTRYAFPESAGKTVSQPQRLRSCVDRSALTMFMPLNLNDKFTTSPCTLAASNPPSSPKILASSSCSLPPPATT